MTKDKRSPSSVHKPKSCRSKQEANPKDNGPPAKRLRTTGSGQSAGPSPSNKWDTSFIQEEPITTCIRNNIIQYGGGSVCLKEMLANADDVRATHFTIVLDKSQYPIQGLLHEDMQDMQKPGLLVGNDAVFSEQDFVGYTRKIGNSFKENDSQTAGQFGRGGMTAYSLSDTIQLVTGNDIMILDPHRTRLPHRQPSLRGNTIDPGSERYVDIQQQAPMQLKPFLSATAACPALPTLSPHAHYPGTLFRLAFRTPEAAATSLICQEAITADDFLASTLWEFCEIAPELLLFTRSVSAISVYVKESADSSAVLMHECKANRKSISTSANSPAALDEVTVTIQGSYQVRSVRKVWGLATSTASPGGTDGVAALLHETESTGRSGNRYSDAKLGLSAVRGKVYATMPLPLTVSGLPVHMNGAFWMQADRRKLWSGEGDRGKGAANGTVFREYVAPAWATLIERMVTWAKSPDEVYRLWPPLNGSLDPKELEPVVDATVPCFVEKNSNILWVPGNPEGLQGRWVSCKEACFLPRQRKLSPQVVAAGRRAGLLIPDIPADAQHALEEAAKTSGHPLPFFSPSRLREALRQAGNVVKPEEIDAVLLYAIKDKQILALDKLYLALLLDGTVQQLLMTPQPPTKQQHTRKQFFTHRREKSLQLYNLLQNSDHRKIKDSEAWRAIARFKDANDQPLLTNGSMNVQTPRFQDLAGSLPTSWTGTLSQRGSAPHPGDAWLASFWQIASQTSWDKLPAPFKSLLLVPLAGDKLASAAFCAFHPTLTSAQLAWACRVCPEAALVLSDLGCLCITEPQAEMACHLQPPISQEAITLAISAAADRCGIPLQQLISEEHLGPDKFKSVCSILASLHVPIVCQQYVRAFLRQCSIFEDITGARLDLAKRTDVKLLPMQEWEQHMLAVQDFFPWTFIKYHSASDTQRRLLHLAGFNPPDLVSFLREDLLPEVYSSESTELEPLLLQALDSLARFPASQLQQPLQVFVNGKLQRVSTLVDSSSDLMQALFAKGKGYAGYDLLPDEYAKNKRLATLRAHGLAHNDLPDPKCFLACADQFVRLYDGKNRSASMIEHSRLLLEMLQRNVSSYKLRSSEALWEETCHLISTKPIFVRALAVAPYDNTTAPLLVSLQDSEDWTHYRLVASIVPVLEPLLGSSTVQLRQQLSLPAGTQVLHVVDHLLQTARARNDQLQNQHTPPPLDKLIQEDVEQAYEVIVEGLDTYLILEQHKELAKLSKKLMHAPWVMVQAAQRFVAPCDLVFDIEQDLDHAIQVPRVLLDLLADAPCVKKWMTDKLQMIDLQHRAPSVKQLHESGRPAGTRAYLADAFNNPEAYPDAVVSVEGRDIHLHKLVVAKGCQVLARQWGPLWQGSSHTVAWDDILGCPECSIKPSYSTAVMFFQFLYSWRVIWPQEEPDMASALELLVMASVYDMPHLVCAAEIALRHAVTVENCCKMLEVADHHAAQQLRTFCLHFVANGHKLVSKSESYQSLTPELLQEVEATRQNLQHSA